MSDDYRILVTGSRDWTDRRLLCEAISVAADEGGRDCVVIVHGACPRGADKLADLYAGAQEFGVERHPANWNGGYGKAAGFVRNAGMVKLGADVCLAFIRNGSRGATHCADLAEKSGIPVRRFTA
jgi:hypothetical protein